MSSGVVGSTAITRSLTKPHKKYSGDVRSVERGYQATGPLVLSIFRQKSHSSLVLNTEHNGMVHRRVIFTCSCEHARARLSLIEAVRFAESLRELAQSSDLQKNMDQ